MKKGSIQTPPPLAKERPNKQKPFQKNVATCSTYKVAQVYFTPFLRLCQTLFAVRQIAKRCIFSLIHIYCLSKLLPTAERQSNCSVKKELPPDDSSYLRGESPGGAFTARAFVARAFAVGSFAVEALAAGALSVFLSLRCCCYAFLLRLPR